MSGKGKTYAVLIQMRDVIFLKYYDFVDADDMNNFVRHVGERTCPTNVLGCIDEIFDLSTGETDPHGILKVVGFIEADNDKRDKIDHWFSCDRELGKTNVNDLIKILQKSLMIGVNDD